MLTLVIREMASNEAWTSTDFSFVDAIQCWSPNLNPLNVTGALFQSHLEDVLRSGEPTRDHPLWCPHASEYLLEAKKILLVLRWKPEVTSFWKAFWEGTGGYAPVASNILLNGSSFNPIQFSFSGSQRSVNFYFYFLHRRGGVLESPLKKTQLICIWVR